MKHLKKFEELEYTSDEKREYQSKVDKIVDKFVKPIKMLKFEKEVIESPRVKLNINIDDAKDSTLTINFEEITIKIYPGVHQKVLSIYKPGNGWVLTSESVEDIFSIISKSSHYLDLGYKDLDNIHKILLKLVNNEDHIIQDWSILSMMDYKKATSLDTKW